MGLSGQHGAQTWTQRPDYKTYKSPYGPGYTINKNFHGIDLRRATKFGITAGSFGAVAGIFALFFFSDVPKVRKDIMQVRVLRLSHRLYHIDDLHPPQKIPIIGDQFDKTVPPSDNVCVPFMNVPVKIYQLTLV
ncbi:hypothetical protein MMC26_004627 [Xylographa opegraphella]|nr:hypothetical protein [Xylographa opegraphella]